MNQESQENERQIAARARARKVGLTSRDLPDWMYIDAFEDGASPASAARQALQAAEEF